MFDQHFLKFLNYMLAYHPDEFGLVPDSNEFFKIKDIFQVLIFTKKFKKLNLNILKQAFSFYYKDFFEFLEPFNIVKPKRCFFTPPIKVDIFEIYYYNKLWTFVKPKIWFKLCTELKWTSQQKMIPLFKEKQLAENWAKVKGAILIEVFPKKIPCDHLVFKFGENLFLTPTLLFEFLKGPLVDQKFIRKYLQKDILPRDHTALKDSQNPSTENTDELQDTPFRKITRGRKKEKPWKDYQKRKQRDKLNF